jgi:cysteine desulfurase
VNSYLYFDHASTTRCSDLAARFVQQFNQEDFGNPSSAHIYGQKAAQAIRQARRFFADYFHVEPEQVIFTGSGSEANNLAIYGIATSALIQKKDSPCLRIVTSEIEHSSVGSTIESLQDFGLEVQKIQVNTQGKIVVEKFLDLLTPSTILISIHQVNNILGNIIPVEELAILAKKKVPQLIFHTDSIQGFGKIPSPIFPSDIDLVSISSHKIEGPKGVGALIILNKKLLKSSLRPLIWGGKQEGGFRSGTQNAGLIAGFHVAAQQALSEQKNSYEHVTQLKTRFLEILGTKRLLTDPNRIWVNSPDNAIPHILSLSIPGFQSGPMARLLEERGCLVSTGSACNSKKSEPEPVLRAMKFPSDYQTSMLRISFSRRNTLNEVEILAQSLENSLGMMKKLVGGRKSR